jgi:hypothetical protein
MLGAVDDWLAIAPARADEAARMSLRKRINAAASCGYAPSGRRARR